MRVSSRYLQIHTLRATPALGKSLVRLKFPQHVHDLPLSIPLCHVQVVNPGASNNFHGGSVLKPVENGDVLLLCFLWDPTASGTRDLHQRHCAHLLESAATSLVRTHDSLCQIWMKSALHAVRISFVISLDVVQSGLSNRSLVVGG